MTDHEKRQQNALHACTIMSDMMKEHGAAPALSMLLMNTPDAMVNAITWLAGQPADRRRELCDEFFGSI